ncbi:MAG: GIY-YIG nuclease family protein [Bacteroidota bacterium]|nr:GIY-YIG nuclease family protein [Bacteroidota bacterium]
MKHPCVYIITNKNNTTLYTGVTSDPICRIEHISVATACKNSGLPEIRRCNTG